MKKKRIHLICNAHLDPVWLWHWEDGATEALSTFRIAADFCEKNRGFVFNHNEAILYQWVEELDPVLFLRIQKLVKSGQWHIAGGSYLQPDVNNPSGESHIRQYLYSLRYFSDRFGVRPTTAYNFDPFGHAEGFPQILAGCGMDSYIFCRPSRWTFELPIGVFRWRDRSGQCVLGRRSDDFYNTNRAIAACLDMWLPHYKDEPETLILWGIGNHGGGVSRGEYRELQTYIRKHPEYEWVESTPEKFFGAAKWREATIPELVGEMQENYPGCYTSMSRLKRAHREAEGLMAATERLCSLAWWKGLAPYPSEDLKTAWKGILFGEFHDVLPGSGTQSVERDSVQTLSHSKEILRRTRLNVLVRILENEARGGEGVVPTFVVNPHGFRVRTQVEFEYNVAHIVSRPVQIMLHSGGKAVPFQRITPEHNLGGDWRVRLAVPVDLAPWQVLRLDASFRRVERCIFPKLPTVSRKALRLERKGLDIRISPRTGLVESIFIKGEKASLVTENAFRPILFKDLDHSWTCGDPGAMDEPDVDMKAPPWKKPDAFFRLATPEEAASVHPQPAERWTKSPRLPQPLRVVEDGPIRTVVEALFVCENSYIARNYVLGKRDGLFEIRDRIFFAHKDHMLKLDVPLGVAPRESISEALYSAVARKPTEHHEERTNQRWVAVRLDGGAYMATLNTGSFAHSLTRTNLCLNLTRSPAYSSFNVKPSHKWDTGRFLPRQDQGEHEVRFRFLFGKRFSELAVTDAAAALNIEPYAQVFYPDGRKGHNRQLNGMANSVSVDKGNVRIVALKKSEEGNSLVVRLQEMSGKETSFSLKVVPHRKRIQATIGPYRLKTMKIAKNSKQLKWREVSLVEDA